jgi:hypothetical protein
MNLTPQAIDNLVEALREYHAISSPLFQRREQREGAKKYLHGLLLDIPRKSIEPMVLAMDGHASLADGRTAGRWLPWRWVGDRVGARHRWKRTFDFPILDRVLSR